MRKFSELVNFGRVKKTIIKVIAAVLFASMIVSDSSIVAMAETLEETEEVEVTEDAEESKETEETEEVEETEESDEIEESEEAEGSEDAEETEGEDTPNEEEVEMLMAPVRGARMMMLGAAPAPEVMTLTPSDGETIDFSTVLGTGNTTTKKIVVNINSNGAYTFTGVNQRSDGEYADVAIIIGSLAEADVNFDGCHIKNDDGECNFYYGMQDDIVPLTVDGIAKIHVLGNSTIETVYEFIAGNGTLYFVDSNEESTLTFQLSKKVADLYRVYIERDYAVVHFQDANVVFKGQTESGENYGANLMDWGYRFNTSKRLVYFEGNKVQFVNTKITLANIYSKAFPLPCTTAECVLMDLDGTEVEEYTIANYQGPTAHIVQIGRKKYTDLQVLESNDQSKVYAPVGAKYMYARMEGSEDVNAYKKDAEGFSTSHLYASAAHRVDFVKADNESVVLDYFYVYEGGNVIFPEEDGNFDYTYTSDGNPVGKETTVTKDMKVLVTKVEKGKVTITIDEVSKLIDYGAALSTVGVSKYLVDTNGKLYKPSDVITETVTLKTLSLSTREEDGKEWFVLNNAEDMDTFATLVNKGNNNINGYLNADVSLNSGFEMIGCADSKFTGTFNGNNHTVTLDINTGNEVGGLFAYISAGATIKNVITAGSVSSDKFAGGLVGSIESKASANVTIEKCINNASVSTTNEDTFTFDGAGGIVAIVTGESGKNVLINNCGNTGTIHILTPTSEIYNREAGILGYANKNINIIISNCFNNTYSILSSFCTNCTNSYSLKTYGEGYGITKSEEAFSSGEVTYLLNEGNESPVWHQKIGVGLPSTTSNDIVYAGYEDCFATELSYSNTEFEHTKQGHQDNGEYFYENGKLYAGCSFCDQNLSAEVRATTEELGSQRGVIVIKSADWIKSEYPSVSIIYATDTEDVFSDEIPSSVGVWAIKALVNTRKIQIGDIKYTVIPKAIHKSSGSDSSHVSYIESVINQINENEEKTAESNNDIENKEVKTIEYNAGSIPQGIMEAMKTSRNTVIHYSATYMGKKYDFIITKEIAALADANVQWCGPLYIQHLFNLWHMGYGNSKQYYTVVKGDTVYDIARKLGTSLTRLLQMNPNLKKDKYIYPGQKILK